TARVAFDAAPKPLRAAVPSVFLAQRRDERISPQPRLYSVTVN
ncbi:MAG: hypothetical protein QOK44_4834, partial [Betaproteobacteria bacterium]|nr:hypothetical protein [Betaproteobacteria bacterium]